MDQQTRNYRIAAVKVADAINTIEGAPVPDFVRCLSALWARGEITGEEMGSSLMDFYRKISLEVRSHHVRGVTKGFPQGN